MGCTIRYIVQLVEGIFIHCLWNFLTLGETTASEGSSCQY
jgi:hypothetical protein